MKTKNGTETTRSITIGLRGDSAVEITSGINVGDQVVITSSASTAGSARFPGGGPRRRARWRARWRPRRRRSRMTPRRPVIALRDVTKVYGEGDTTVHALRGVSLDIATGEYVAIMGASGKRQEHADAHHRLSRRRHVRSLRARRPRRVAARRLRALGRAEPQDRVRLPELQPHSAHLRVRERRAPDGRTRTFPRPNARTVPTKRCVSSASPIAAGTSRTSCRAVSNNASRSHARSSPTPRSSSPTSRRARSTARPRTKCSISSTACTVTVAP